MWPLWLIGVVAAVLSLSLAATTSILTFVFLQRRIRYLQNALQRHETNSAITFDRTSQNQDVEQPYKTDHARSSFQRDFRMPATATTNNDRSEMKVQMINRAEFAQVQADLERSTINGDQGLVQPLRHSSQHSKKKRNRLKRGMHLKSLSLSPLSAITERSHSSNGSPGPAEAISLSERSSPEVQPQSIPWPLEVLKTRQDTGPDEEDQTSHPGIPNLTSNVKHEKDLVHHYGIEIAQQGPPSDKNRGHPPKSDDDLNGANALITAPCDQCEKWEDFDFGLRPQSQSSLSIYDRDLTPSPNLHHDPCRHDREAYDDDSLTSDFVSIPTNRWSDELAKQRANSLTTGPPGRHSMYVDGRGLQVSSSALKLRSLEDYESGSMTRPSNVSHREGDISSQSFNLTSNPPPRAANGPIRQHRRQNCIRISGIPIISLQGSHGRRSLHTGNGQLCLPSTQDCRNSSHPWPRPLMLRRPKPLSETKRENSDVFIDTESEESCGNMYVSDDNEATPLRRAPSPNHFHDSPTLPSPAYTSAKLFPRRPALHGPRIFQPAMSSLKPRHPSKWQRDSTDLRRSIVMLKSMEAEETVLRTRSQIMPSYNLDSEYRPTCSQRNSFSENKQNGLASQTSSRPSTPGTNITVSQSEISIWEDASVRGETPDPEVSSLHSTMALDNVLSSVMVTPAKKIVHFEDTENHPQNAFRESIVEGDIRIPTRGSKADQSVLYGRPWGTPGSLYDELGFLKE